MQKYWYKAAGAALVVALIMAVAPAGLAFAKVSNNGDRASNFSAKWQDILLVELPIWNDQIAGWRSQGFDTTNLQAAYDRLTGLYNQDKSVNRADTTAYRKATHQIVMAYDDFVTARRTLVEDIDRARREVTPGSPKINSFLSITNKKSFNDTLSTLSGQIATYQSQGLDVSSLQSAFGTLSKAYSQFSSLTPSDSYYVSSAANVNEAYANYNNALHTFRYNLEHQTGR
jgi:hypothetical protein